MQSKWIQFLKWFNYRLSNYLVRVSPPDLSDVKWPAPRSIAARFPCFSGIDTTVYLIDKNGNRSELTSAQRITYSILSDKSVEGTVTCVDLCEESLLTRDVLYLELRGADEHGFVAVRTISPIQFTNESQSISIDDIVFERHFTFNGAISDWVIIQDPRQALNT